MQMQTDTHVNGQERESRPTIYSDLSADDQTFEMIKNLQEELAIERRSARRLEEQLMKSQQRWNFFFAQYEGMLKAQLDPIFDQVDIIFGKLIGNSHFLFGFLLFAELNLSKQLHSIVQEPPKR